MSLAASLLRSMSALSPFGETSTLTIGGSLGVGDASVGLAMLSAMGSTPFMVWQFEQRHVPMASSVLAPGGACPFTRRQFWHIRARRFLGCISSSPNRTSMSRSYQLEPLPSMTYCGTALKAFGANSAFSACMEGGCQLEGEEPAVCGGFGGGVKGAARSSVPVAEDGARGIFAVGGGRTPVSLPFWLSPEVAVDAFLRLVSGFDAALPDPPPYFSNSWSVVSYLVASLSLATVASRCFCKEAK